MVNPENAEPSTTAAVQTAVQQVDEEVMPKIPCFVMGFEEILLRFPYMKDRSVTSKLVKVLPDPKFVSDIFTTIFKNLKDCEELSCENTKENEKADRFRRVPVICGRENNKDHGTLYMKNVCETLQAQVQLCEKDNIMFHPDREKRISAVISLSMTTAFFIRCFKK